MTNLGDLIDRARSFTRDSDGRFVVDDDLVAYANEAVDDLGSRLQLFDHEFVGTVDPVLGVTIPTSPDPAMVEILSLRLFEADTDVVFVSTRQFRETVAAGLDLNYTIGHYWDDGVEVYPEAESELVYTLRYKSLPTPMGTPDDEVPTPRWLDRKIVAYMTAMALMKEKEDGSTFLSIYEQGLPTISNGRERFFTRPLQITRRPNAFDLQTDARHL